MVAVALGWCAYLSSSYKNELIAVANYHKILGTIATISLIATAIVNTRRRKQQDTKSTYVYWIFAVVTAATVGITGYLGSSLIFGLGHYHW